MHFISNDLYLSSFWCSCTRHEIGAHCCNQDTPAQRQNRLHLVCFKKCCSWHLPPSTFMSTLSSCHQTCCFCRGLAVSTAGNFFLICTQAPQEQICEFEKSAFHYLPFQSFTLRGTKCLSSLSSGCGWRPHLEILHQTCRSWRLLRALQLLLPAHQKVPRTQEQ